jgi:hypothetical protein
MKDPLHTLIVLAEKIWDCKKSLLHTRNKKEVKTIENTILEIEILIPKLKKEVELLKELYNMNSDKKVFKPTASFGKEITNGCKLFVQNIKEPIDVYQKEDGNLYFKPYGKEELVNSYFSNDLILLD